LATQNLNAKAVASSLLLCLVGVGRHSLITLAINKANATDVTFNSG
jgi:hypothetical protein